MSEKIRIKEQEFNLVPMGISFTDKQRGFTISSALTSIEIETAFSDVDKIEYLSEAGEVLSTYFDGVSLKALSKDITNSTYTVVIGIDAVEKKIQSIDSELDDLANTIAMISMM